MLVAEFQPVEGGIEHAGVALDFIRNNWNGHALVEAFGGDALGGGGHFFHGLDGQRSETSSAEPRKCKRERQPSKQREQQSAGRAVDFGEVLRDGKSYAAIFHHDKAQLARSVRDGVQTDWLRAKSRRCEIRRTPADFGARAQFHKAWRIAQRQPFAHLGFDILPVKFDAAVTIQLGEEMRTFRTQFGIHFAHLSLMDKPRRTDTADDDRYRRDERGPKREPTAKGQLLHSATFIA